MGKSTINCHFSIAKSNKLPEANWNPFLSPYQFIVHPSIPALDQFYVGWLAGKSTICFGDVSLLRLMTAEYITSIISIYIRIIPLVH
jgi:hypothetical protein